MQYPAPIISDFHSSFSHSNSELLFTDRSIHSFVRSTAATNFHFQPSSSVQYGLRSVPFSFPASPAPVSRLPFPSQIPHPTFLLSPRRRTVRSGLISWCVVKEARKKGKSYRELFYSIRFLTVECFVASCYCFQSL